MNCSVFRHKRRVNGKSKCSRLWYGKYRQAGENKATGGRAASQRQTGGERKAKADCQRAGARDGGSHRPQELRDSSPEAVESHLKDFVANLQAVGRDEKYVRELNKKLMVLIGDCAWNTVREVTPDSFEAWRSKQKSTQDNERISERHFGPHELDGATSEFLETH